MRLSTAVLAVASLLPVAAPVTAEAQQVVSGKSHKAARRADTGLVATLPGFEMLPDGGSRFFVELSHTANVTEKRDGRALSYVISGARVVHRNNENPLVTVHFNTPVSQARLVPAHGGLVFSVELRADSTPTWRITDGDEGTSVLQIDFAKGSFVSADDQQDVAYDAVLPPTSAEAAPAAAAPTTPQAHGGHGGHAGHGGGHRTRGAPVQ